MKIYGAGLAGLLAANMLRRYKPTVFEAQQELPNNHEALLRFRSDAVARATGIPFKRVTVTKAVSWRGRLLREADLAMNNMYSFKVTGEVMGRSIMNMAPAERFIAPANLITQMADGLDIQYGCPMQSPLSKTDEVIISTIPMPYLMKMARWDGIPEFKHQTITSITCDLTYPAVDVYQTIYFPEATMLPYRASLTGNHLIIEMRSQLASDDEVSNGIIDKVLVAFGFLGYKYVGTMNKTVKVQAFGKIVPIAEDVRRQFILAMTDLYGIYSVGRYGTWRQILLDDVVHDIQIVEQFIAQRDSYSRTLSHIQGGSK